MTLLQSIVPGLARPACPTTGATATEARVRPVYAVREDDHGYLVTVHLPGVAKDGLEITAQDNELTIAGCRAWQQPAGWTSLYRETPRASFGLTFSHAGDIDADKISAELKEGILNLTLPKAEAAKPRKIAIN